MSALQKMFRFSGVSAEHTGSKPNKKSILEVDLSTAAERLEYADWNLVLMDLNGTLLYRKWLGFNEGYGPCVLRPSTTQFIEMLSNETRTVLGIWTGATSVKKAKVLLKHLADAGVQVKDFVCWIPALPGCKSRKCFEGTTKPIWVKPISVLQQQILPKLKQVYIAQHDVHVCIHYVTHPY